MNSSKLLSAVALAGIFFLTAGGSYWAFSSLKKSSPVVSAQPNTNNVAASPTKKSRIDPSIPRTEVCPINGALFTKQEKDAWMQRRPLAVMIENSTDARPQAGLSTADVVYEAVAEGGITRFMGIFYCNASLAGNVQVAPVRSARIYFVNLMSEYDALYNHVGGAGQCDDPNVDPRAKALCLIRTAKIKDMDQMGYAGEFKICHRVTNRLNKDVAYEHTMSCFLDEIYKKADALGWGYKDSTTGQSWDKNYVSWKFKTTTTKATGSAATNISYNFWTNQPAFDVNWKYDSSTNSYTRFNAGVQSVDQNTNEPLKFNNVVVEYAVETSLADVEKHMLYDVIGTGKAQVFMDGVVIPATWSKASRTARTLYKDATGKEIVFNPGPTWISIIPSVNTVTYQ